MPEGGRERQATGTFLDQEARIAALAAHRHLILSLDDLGRCGLTAKAVQHRARIGMLHRIYRGVYSLVPRDALSVNGRRLAAVLACGPGAALSRRTGGDQQGLRRTIRARIDIIVPATNRSAGHPGIDLHRSRTLTAADVELVDGIPTTTVARTLLDLAGVVRPEELERALDQARGFGSSTDTRSRINSSATAITPEPPRFRPPSRSTASTERRPRARPRPSSSP